MFTCYVEGQFSGEKHRVFDVILQLFLNRNIEG